MTANHCAARVMIAVSCCVMAGRAVRADVTPDADGTGATASDTPATPPAAPKGPLSIHVEYPADGSILHTRQPWMRVCVSGGDETTRSSLKASLDGENISRSFKWSGECAQFRPSEGWIGLGKRHAWSDPPYDADAWSSEMRDGGHDFEASVSDASGASAAVKSRFRIETEHTAVSLGVGFPNISLEGFDGSFAPANLLEARFGWQRVWTIAKDEGVVRYTDKFGSIGGISTRLADASDPDETPDDNETETTLWKFAVGRRKGYGYRTGDTAFIAPYQGTSIFFARLDAYAGPYSPADVLALEPFDDTTRVGASFEGGVAFGISRSITLDAGYEEIAVYPHYVFWPAAGSGLVHGIALAVADGVSKQVAKTSPRAAPIVSFILRNGISYAIYHQRRSEVNWPFGGGPGLIYQGIKVSFTFTY